MNIGFSQKVTVEAFIDQIAISSLVMNPSYFTFVFNCCLLQHAATFPLDLVRRRMQLEGAGGRARVYNTSLFGTFKHILQNEGLRGLYRGILPEYYKVVPSVGIVFMTYETLKVFLSSSPS